MDTELDNYINSPQSWDAIPDPTTIMFRPRPSSYFNFTDFKFGDTGSHILNDILWLKQHTRLLAETVYIAADIAAAAGEEE